MAMFIGGLVLFFGTHYFTTFARGPRAALIGRLGEMPYKGLYALISLAGFILIVLGWSGADATVLYTTPLWLRPVTHGLMLVALVLIVAAYLPAGKVAAGVKHPMLAAVKIWAFAHLLVNGEVRSILLFGAFLAYAVIDRIAVKKRGDNGRPAGPARNDLVALIVGTAVYAAIFFYLHRYIAGVALS